MKIHRIGTIRVGSVVFASIAFGMLGGGCMTASNQNRAPVAVAERDPAERAKAENGQMLLDAIEKHLPEEDAKIDALTAEWRRAGESKAEVTAKALAVVQQVVKKKVKRCSVPTLKAYFDTRTRMMSELAQRNPEKAVAVMMGTASIAFEDVSVETNRRIAESLRDVIVDGSHGTPVPQDRNRALKGFLKAGEKLTAKEIDLISSDLAQVKDKTGYVHAFNKLTRVMS